MNYFLANLFNDRKWWAKIGVAIVAALNLMDILSATFAYPGFFGLWIVRATVIAGIGGLLGYYVYQNRHDNRERRLQTLLPGFIAERRAFFDKMCAADPAFQTFCYECHHYDGRRKSCCLNLYNRTVKIKFHPYATFEYCLYWNLCDHPIMDLTDRIFPSG